MKKTLLLFTIIANQLYGTNTDSVIKFSKWDIGISISPDYSYRVLKPIGSTYTSPNLIVNQCADSLNTIEKATTSWTIGIPVTYHFNKFISFKTGINVSNKAIKSKGFVCANPYYYGYTSYNSSSWTKQNFYFLEVPFSLQFTYRPKRFKKINYSIMGGGTICSNIQEHYYDSRRFDPHIPPDPNAENNSYKLYIDKFKLLYVGYTFGLKITYKLNEKLMLGLEPVYKFYGKEFVSLSPDYTGSTIDGKFSRELMRIKEKPYSYGINLTLEFTK